jgi:septum formation protein
MKLVLASTSPYRCALLQRLQLPFSVIAPDIDESPLPDEKPSETALRLAIAKAQTAAQLGGEYAQSLIIGSDQVAHLGSLRLGKPGTTPAAMEQLRLMRGQTVCFETAVCLLNTTTAHQQVRTVTTQARVRHLSDEEIERYLARENALDCAGSARSEGLGICLLDALHGEDPTALIGLPLIALSAMLRNEGIALP